MDVLSPDTLSLRRRLKETKQQFVSAQEQALFNGRQKALDWFLGLSREYDVCCNQVSARSTGAVLRAAEINADAILLAKNIDGVYSADPAKDPSAVKYDAITYDEVLARHLAVMDTTATSLSMDNHIPVQVFALKDPQNILLSLIHI